MRVPYIKLQLVLALAPISVAQEPAAAMPIFHSRTKEISRAIAVLSPNLATSKVALYSHAVKKAALKYQIDPQVLVAIAFQESSFRSNLPEGAAGELGICQIRKIWLSEIHFREAFPNAKLSDLTKPTQSFEFAAWLLSTYKERSEDSLPYWTRFNSGNFNARKVYFERVSKHLRRIDFMKKFPSSVASL